MDDATEHRRRHPAEPRNSDGSHSEEEPVDAEELTELRTQLEEERERADTNHANWQRATADFINFKRRTEQEREEQARFANTALILNVLPSADDLERALQHVDPALENTVWIEGVRQILRKLKGALTAAGVTEIEAIGEPFDPNLHEAIAEAEGQEGVVVSEAQRGYKLGDRVIRPSMVMVGRGGGADGAPAR
jgi:molecular chaperone GrpE